MEIIILPPRHYEIMHGSSDAVHAYLEQIIKDTEDALSSDVIDTVHISLLVAHPEEIAQGKFLEYTRFDWRCKFAAVGVNGDFYRYHSGNDLEKIRVVSEMLQSAFLKISKKKRAKIDFAMAYTVVMQTTNQFEEAMREH